MRLVDVSDMFDPVELAFAEDGYQRLFFGESVEEVSYVGKPIVSGYPYPHRYQWSLTLWLLEVDALRLASIATFGVPVLEDDALLADPLPPTLQKTLIPGSLQMIGPLATGYLRVPVQVTFPNSQKSYLGLSPDRLPGQSVSVIFHEII